MMNTVLVLILLLVGFIKDGYSKNNTGIVHLPNTPTVSFNQFSGYITVDELNGRNLFYFLVEADTNPSEKPLLLWLNGGPGCSSIGYGAMGEIGAFLINSDGTSVDSNKYSWNKVANLLFLDTPSDVGFSYAKSSSTDDYNDFFTANDNLNFLKKWFEEFPNYKNHEFYLAGESYAGHYVPQLSQKILSYNKAIPHPINLVGILLGNPITDYYFDEFGKLEYEYGHGMISYKTYTKAQIVCVSSFKTGDFTEECSNILDEINNEIGSIDAYSVYTDLCSSSSSSTASSNPCYEDSAAKYFNNPIVQEALHVKSNGFHNPWKICNYVINDKWVYNISSVLGIVKELIDAQLRVFYYSGDTDLMVPFTGTRKAIASLGLPTEQSWRPWYTDNKHSGWTTKYKGIRYATVRGATHQVPQSKQEAALTIFQSFIKNEELPFK